MGAYTNVVTELITRLTYHTANVSARILQAWTFQPLATTEVEGQKDLPSLRIFVPSIKETYLAEYHIRPGFNLNLLVSTPRADGLSGFLSGCEKVMDAIERKGVTALTLDPCLSNTLQEPVTLSVTSPFIHQLCYAGTVLCEFNIPRIRRGARRT